MTVRFQAPQPLLPTHQCGGFSSSEPELDAWLTRRALANQRSGASRTFVVVDAQQTVLGYYALAAGAVSHQVATSAVRRNMPDPVPVMVLARLAVDQRVQGFKLGASLLQDAVKRCALVSQHAGIRALLVHALHDQARQFYEHYGFQASPVHPLTLLLRLPHG